MNRRRSSEALDEAGVILSGLARENEPIGARTTYRVGGSAALYVEIDSEFTLERVINAVSTTDIEVLILGNGSNLVICEDGFPGLCVTLTGEFATIAIDEQRASVEAGGGVAYPVLARQTASAGLRGMEWAVGVPGTVGGAVAMNAGGHGAETADRLVAAQVIGLSDRTNRTLTPRELDLGYRRSVVGASDLVVTATFFLEPGSASEAEEEISSIVRWRHEHQPGGRNAGSVFKNPVGDAAGRIIEAAGLKGYRCGSASVSQKHANFIQVDESGSSNDIRRLVRELQELVEKRLGIVLSTEVRFIGFGE